MSKDICTVQKHWKMDIGIMFDSKGLQFNLIIHFKLFRNIIFYISKITSVFF